MRKASVAGAAVAAAMGAAAMLAGPAWAQKTSAEYIAEAKTLTDPAFQSTFDRQCAVAPPRPDLGNGVPVEGIKLFDNLAYTGRTDVSSWALNTSDGVVLFDTLYNAKDAETIVEPALRKVGFDPARIKAVIISHGHGDHFGGAGYFKAKYGAKVYASEEDWKAILAANPPVLAKDQVLTDGMNLTFGDTTLTFVSTPGHTPGAMSVLFPAVDGAQRRSAIWLGGTGPQNTLPAHRMMVRSMEHLRPIAEAAKVEVMLNVHPHIDETLPRLEALRKRQAGQPNPFVIGVDGYRRFADMVTACWRADVVRMEAEPPRAAR